MSIFATFKEILIYNDVGLQRRVWEQNCEKFSTGWDMEVEFAAQSIKKERNKKGKFSLGLNLIWIILSRTHLIKARKYFINDNEAAL